MNKLYNMSDEVVNRLNEFFKSCDIPLNKPNINNLSNIIFSETSSQSIVTADIASSIKSPTFSNNSQSTQKRIWRFFNNKHIDIYAIFNSIIKKVISNISNVRHKKLVITLDHMFTKDNFVTLMFTLKIDAQGIPIWFSTERTLSNCHLEIQKKSRKKLFSEDFIKNAIDEVIELLSPLNSQIIFLADRWFFNLSLMKHIADKNCFYCFRAKAKSSVKFSLYNEKEGHNITTHLYELQVYKYHSVYYENLILGDIGLQANLVISKEVPKKDKDEDEDDNDKHWYIVTNLECNIALKMYAQRYGAIEMFFKSNKTNGFYLEDTKTKNLHAFETLYGTICIATLWLNIIGVDYIKNFKALKKRLCIDFSSPTKSGKSIRKLSTFKLGLTVFKELTFSTINIVLKTNFKLYL